MLTSALSQQLGQKQQLALTPQLQTALRLLQANNLELTDLLADTVLRNPFIRLKTPISDFSFAKSDRFDHWLQQQSTPQVSLEDHLNAQINLYKNPVLRLRLKQLVYCLDEHGYLPKDLSKLAQILKYSKEALTEVIIEFQTLDPPGIGAQSLEECLKIQIQRFHKDPLMSALLALEPHLLATHNWAKIAEKLQTTTPAVQQAFSALRKLTPYPAENFLSSTVLPSAYPEVQVHFFQKKPIVTLMNHHFPELNFDYKQFQQLASKEKNDRALQRYLNKQLQEYRWLVSALDKRKTTLLEVTTIIVTHQIQFFLDEQTPLVPLTIQQIATELQRHPSTVSRTIQGKSLQTDHRSYPLRQFIKNTSADQNYSDAQVKILIQQLIQQEAKEHPLSDQALVECLHQKQIQISRRTVAKYRSILNIPTSRQRRITP